MGRKNSSFQSLNITNDNHITTKVYDIKPIVKPLIKNNNSMVFNNNILFYSKQFSPSSGSIRTTVPNRIEAKANTNKVAINLQKKNKIMKLLNSNSLNDIYPQNNNNNNEMLSPRIRQFIDMENNQIQYNKKINIIHNIHNNGNINKINKIKKINNIFTRINKPERIEKRNNYTYKCKKKQINNFNNINHVNIHIYSNKLKVGSTNNDLNTINSTKSKIKDNYSFLEYNNNSKKNNITNDNIIEKKNIIERNNEFYRKNNNNTIKVIPLTPKKQFQKKYYTNTEHKYNTHKIQNYRNDNRLQNLTTNHEAPPVIRSPKERTYKNPKYKNLKELSNLSMLSLESNNKNNNTIMISNNNKNNNTIMISNINKNNNNNNNINRNYKSSTFKLVGNIIINDKKRENLTKKVNKRYHLDAFDYFDEKVKERDNISVNFNMRDDNNVKGNYETITHVNKKKDELKKINETKYYLKDFTDDNNKILLFFLKLIQIHIDVELLLVNKISNNFRNKSTSINNDKISKLNSLINNYFNTLSNLQQFNGQENNNANAKANTNNEIKNNRSIFDDANCSSSFLYQKYNIFNYNIINNLFQKTIKIQMCYFASFLVSLAHLSADEIDNIIKTDFDKIIKEISNPLYSLFKYFIMNEIRDKYTKLLSTNMRPTFFDGFNKLFYEDKISPNTKKGEILDNIAKGINKSIDSLKQYSNTNLKGSSIIKPFGEALSQLLHSIERKTINKFINIFLDMILFGELEINKQKMYKNLEFQNKVNVRCKIKKNPNVYEGSAIFNNITDNAPYLPEMNKKYKYTLVLDMDETLVHFFFTTVNGMFFVRPYCLEFLNELNKYYEIVTFTAGLKDYADNILNLLDVNDNIIKFRLYRQHVTVNGFNSYKNLKLLGRDIKKMIIIDNLKENFALNPDNGLFIKTWTSDINDTQFIDLLKILKSIALSDLNDVRPIIQAINESIKYIGDLLNPYSKVNIKRIIDDLKVKK